jgi:hypothetical protein
MLLRPSTLSVLIVRLEKLRGAVVCMCVYIYIYIYIYIIYIKSNISVFHKKDDRIFVREPSKLQVQKSHT